MFTSIGSALPLGVALIGLALVFAFRAARRLAGLLVTVGLLAAAAGVAGVDLPALPVL